MFSKPQCLILMILFQRSPSLGCGLALCMLSNSCCKCLVFRVKERLIFFIFWVVADLTVNCYNKCAKVFFQLQNAVPVSTHSGRTIAEVSWKEA